MEKVIEHAELDSFTEKIKSSVKLIKNSRGVGWEIRVVTGEEGLVDGLMRSAVKVHKDLIEEVKELEEKK